MVGFRRWPKRYCTVMWGGMPSSIPAARVTSFLRRHFARGSDQHFAPHSASHTKGRPKRYSLWCTAAERTYKRAKYKEGNAATWLSTCSPAAWSKPKCPPI